MMTNTKITDANLTGSQIEALRDIARRDYNEDLARVCECAMFGLHQVDLGMTRADARAAVVKALRALARFPRARAVRDNRRVECAG